MPHLPRTRKTLGRKTATANTRASEVSEVIVVTAIMTAIATVIEIVAEIETESGMQIETVSVVSEAETGVREKRIQKAWIL